MDKIQDFFRYAKIVLSIMWYRRSIIQTNSCLISYDLTTIPFDMRIYKDGGLVESSRAYSVAEYHQAINTIEGLLPPDQNVCAVLVFKTQEAHYAYIRSWRELLQDETDS